MAVYDITIRVSSDDPSSVHTLTDMISDPGAQVGYQAEEWGITILDTTVAEVAQ